MRKDNLLSQDEGLAVLAACVQTLASAGLIAHVMDGEDKKAVEDLRSGTAKLAQQMGMSLNDLANFAAMAAGEPTPELIAFFRRSDPN